MKESLSGLVERVRGALDKLESTIDASEEVAPSDAAVVSDTLATVDAVLNNIVDNIAPDAADGPAELGRA